YSYNVTYNAFKRLSRSYSPTERALMFHDTAVARVQDRLLTSRRDANTPARVHRSTARLTSTRGVLHPTRGYRREDARDAVRADRLRRPSSFECSGEARRRARACRSPLRANCSSSRKSCARPSECSLREGRETALAFGPATASAPRPARVANRAKETVMTSPASLLHSSAWRGFGAAAMTAIIFLLARTEPAEAQKKISLLTWNIPVYKEKIDGWIADFKQLHPDVQVEWLDKKGTEWATFYQTQVVGGAAPDIIDVQGALWLEYAAHGGGRAFAPHPPGAAPARDRGTPQLPATRGPEG